MLLRVCRHIIPYVAIFLLYGEWRRGNTEMRVAHTAKSMRHSSVATADPDRQPTPV